MESREELADPIDLNDCRPVDPHEPVGIELLLESSEGLAQQMLVSTGVQRHVVVRRLDPVDVGKFDDDHAA